MAALYKIQLLFHFLKGVYKHFMQVETVIEHPSVYEQQNLEYYAVCRPIIVL